MIIPRIKYFASRDFAGLGEDAQTYLKSARRNYARDLISARRTENSAWTNQLIQDKSKLRSNASRVDRMLKDPEKVSEARKMIKKEVGFDRYSNNLESGKVAEARISRAGNYANDPLLKNKNTRADRAAALKAERLAKQPAKASYVKPESVVKPAQKATYVKPEAVIKQPVVQPKASYVKPESVIKSNPVVQPKASYIKPESVVKPKVVKEAGAVQNKGREELVKTLRAKKALGQNLKRVGYVGLGVAGAAGLAYGAKKLYDRNKQQKEFARADYAGLGETGKQLFRNFRNNLAKQLNGERNQINSRLAEKIKRGSSSLGEFKDLANQKREILQRQVRSDSRYVKNAYKDMGL